MHDARKWLDALSRTLSSQHATRGAASSVLCVPRAELAVACRWEGCPLFLMLLEGTSQGVQHTCQGLVRSWKPALFSKTDVQFGQIHEDFKSVMSHVLFRLLYILHEYGRIRVIVQNVCICLLTLMTVFRYSHTNEINNSLLEFGIWRPEYSAWIIIFADLFWLNVQTPNTVFIINIVTI